MCCVCDYNCLCDCGSVDDDDEAHRLMCVLCCECTDEHKPVVVVHKCALEDRCTCNSASLIVSVVPKTKVMLKW